MQIGLGLKAFKFQLDMFREAGLVPFEIDLPVLAGEERKSLIGLLAGCGRDFDLVDATDIHSIIFNGRLNLWFLAAAYERTPVPI